MPDLRIGERGESVIDFMTEHLGGFFDGLKDILNFGAALGLRRAHAA